VSGLLTIQSVSGAGPSYSLTVVSSTGVLTADHVVAPLVSNNTKGGIYRVTGVPDGTTIDIEDDLVPGGGAYGAPDAGPGAFWTPAPTTGISTDKANATPFWGSITERDLLLLETTGSGEEREAETLTFTNTTNRVMGPLKSTPSDVFEVNVHITEGTTQEEALDYSVREVTGGSAPGFYICFSPTSTAPGGGVFAGGSNPSTGIFGDLVSGDKFRVVFSA